MDTKSSIKFLPQIDGLRFFAVFGVMIHHWLGDAIKNNETLRSIPFGTGVCLFFVISGFLITSILLNKKEDVANKKSTILMEMRNFYVKRTLRIFPIYYLLILVLCLAYYSEIKDYFVYLLTYTVNWYMVFKSTYIGTQTPLWSLAVEEQFYLIWPILIFIVPKRRIVALIVVAILISFASRIYFAKFSPYYLGESTSTFSCFDALGYGALIGYLQKEKPNWLSTRKLKWILLSTIIIYIIVFVFKIPISQSLQGNLFSAIIPIIFFFVVAIAANNGFTRGLGIILENKVILYLGKISYGLYLYHNFMGEIYWRGFNQYLPEIKSDFFIFILYFAMTVTLATITWYCIERPILSFKKHFQ